jgi:uncharacterized protein (TIGR03067 family)
LFAALLVLPLLGSDAPRGYEDGEAAADVLEGRWRKVRVVYGGQDLGASGQPLLTVRDGTFTWEGSTPATAGTYVLRPGTRPARVDQLPTSGPGKDDTWRMIYRVDGDTLLIAYTVSLREYPKGFDDPDAFVTTMRRERK